MIDLRIQKVRDVKSPERGHPTDAGIDLFIPTDLGWTFKKIQPGSDLRIPSGLKFGIPTGQCLTFVNKSGVAYNKKLIIGGQLVDSGYAGEVHLHLINVSTDPVMVTAGQKIAQFIILPVPSVNFIFTDKLYHEETERGSGAFGSTDA